jgi:hypothetical protein
MLRLGISGRLQDLVYNFSLLVVFCVNVSIIVGQSLASQFTRAITMRARHIALFRKFSARFTPATIETWTARITAWEADTSKPCPYEEPSNGESKLYKKIY